MKKIYESPVAEVVSFTALEQMATMKSIRTVDLPKALSLEENINYDAIYRDTSMFTNF